MVSGMVDSLAITNASPHTVGTCGQSRGGGLVTSDSRRRSISFGRVAVTYVQGSPKGGGALGLLEVTSTRLTPVPPYFEGVLGQMAGRNPNTANRILRSFKAGMTAVSLSLAALMAVSATTAQAQLNPTEQRERAERVARVSQSIKVTPDSACELPKSDIRNYLSDEVNRYGLIDNINRTVMGIDPEKPLTGMAALMESTRRETERKYARSQAIARGEEAVVGKQPQASARSYNAQLFDITATSRIDNGLTCEANVRADSLRFPITYDVWAAPSDADGWSARLRDVPSFTEEGALTASSTLRVAYNGAAPSLAEARDQGRLDRTRSAQKREDDEERRLAGEAYANSPAGRADAARFRQEMIAKQKSCEANGGTWGVPSDSSTIMRVNAANVTGYLASLQACYFLGRR